MNDHAFSPWKRKFVFLWKYENAWIFCRYIWVRHRLVWRLGVGVELESIKDYAFDEFELIQKTASQ